VRKQKARFDARASGNNASLLSPEIIGAPCGWLRASAVYTLSSAARLRVH